MRRPVIALVFVLATLGMPAAAAAQNTVDGHVWLQVLATVRLSENWRLHLEEQPRWFENGTESFQILTRTALGRRIHDRATLWGGYAWIAKPPGPASRTSTARGSSSRPASRTSHAGRRPSASASSSGSRTTGRERRTGCGPWGASHARWTTAVRGPRLPGMNCWSRWTRRWTAPGRASTRTASFAGVLRQFSPSTGPEFGYLWTTSEPPASARTHAHVAFAWLNLTF
ncbi:MAG: DUF2490 domain-containing protein [Vicinamibacterales bacterium]